MGVSVNGLAGGQCNDRCRTVDFDIQDGIVNNCRIMTHLHPNVNGSHILYGLSFFKYYAIGFSVIDTSFLSVSEHSSFSSSPKNTTNLHRHTPQVPITLTYV
jgi:hypothetical protein